MLRSHQRTGGDLVAQIHDELRAEGVVKEGRAVRMSGKLGFYGRLWLTSQRLVFLQWEQAVQSARAIPTA